MTSTVFTPGTPIASTWLNDVNALVYGGSNQISFTPPEVPNGAIDGVNKTYTLTKYPVGGSLMYFVNGVYQTPGGVDYTLSGNTITRVTALIIGDSHVVAAYRY
jgi:hypothetical protein